jgi:3',5'-cyclic AMP phosphodiesterase CpdA
MEAILPLRPRFVIAGGDLTERGLENEFIQLREILKPLKVPVYAMPGNHDTRWKGKPLFTKYVGRGYRSLNVEGYHLVLLDTSPEGQPDGYLDPAQIQWVRSDLDTIDPNMPVLVFSHHPLGQGAVGNEDEVLRLLRNRKTVLYVAGHSHRSSVVKGQGAVYVEDSGILEGTFLSLHITGNTLDLVSVDFLSGTRHDAATVRVDGQPALGFRVSVLQQGMDLRVLAEGEMGTRAVTRLGSLPAIELRGVSNRRSTAIDVAALASGNYLLTVRSETTGQPSSTVWTRVSLVTQSPLTPVWTVNTSQSIGGLASAGNTVIATGSSGEVWAFDAVSGVKKWTTRLGSAPAGSALVAGHTAIVASTAGTIYAFDLSEGSMVWASGGYDGVLQTPTVSGDHVFVSAGTRVISLSARTGIEQWSFDAGVQLAPTLTASGDRVFVGCFDGSLLCVGYDGRELWRAPVERTFYHSPVFAAPVVAHGVVVVGTPLNPRGTGNTLHAFNLQDGKPVWSLNVGSVLSGPAVTQAGFAVSTMSGRIAMVGGGKVTRTLGLPKYFGGTMTYGAGLTLSPDGRQFAGVDSGGYVYLFASNGSGEVKVAVSLGANSYTAALWVGGRLVVAAMDGRIRSYSVKL